MRTLMTALMATMVMSGAASAELVVHTAPAELAYEWRNRNYHIPPNWQNPPAQSFNPSLPPSQDGSDAAGLMQGYGGASSSTGLVYLTWYHDQGEAGVSIEPTADPFMQFLVFQDGFLDNASGWRRPISYEPGQSVGPDATYGNALIGWARGTVPSFWSKYRHSSGTPGVFHDYFLPEEMTIGIFFKIDGQTHYGWAEVRWNPTATIPAGSNFGRWEVLRWAYETEPNTPAVVIPPPLCAGDANGDGATNGADLSVLLAQFGTSVTPNTGGDFNGDGNVDGADLSVLLSGFGCE